MRLKEKLRFLLGLPLTIVAFAFIGKLLWDNRNEISKAFLEADLFLFAVGTLLITCFFAIKSFIWIEILKARGFSPHSRKTLYQYSMSEVKRYIPGSIFAFISRAQSHEQTVPKKETFKGIGIEASLLVSSSTVVSLPAIYFLLNSVDSKFVLLLNLVILLFISFGIIALLLKKRVRLIFFSYIDSFLMYIVAWGFYAVGSLFIALSIFEFPLQNLTELSSMLALSWLAGYLFFLTPMGLGVRELVITFGLTLFAPTAIAGTVAIMGRVGMIIAELLFLAITKLNLKRKSFNLQQRLNPYLSVVVFLSFTYFLFFSYFTIERHNSYFSGRFDLGNMTQTVWNTSQGRFFVLTNPDGVEQMSRLGVHSDYLLALISPLYFFWSDPRMLLIFQSAALATGGIVTYFLAKRILKNELLSTAFSVSYLTNFWLHEQNIFDFHAVSIATPLLLFTVYFLTLKRFALFSLFLALSVTTKENVLLLVSAFGLLFLRQKKWLIGSFFAIAGVFLFLFVTSQLIPNARGEEHFALGTYKQLGDSPGGIITNIVSNPSIVFSQIFNKSTLLYINQHLLPTGYLSLLSPIYYIFVIPDAAIYLLSDNYEYRSYQYHFGALFIPFLIVASIYSTQTLTRKFDSIYFKKILTYYVIGMGVLTMYFYSPVPGMKNADYKPFTTDHSRIAEYLTLIPSSASVSSTNNLGAHLSHREYIYTVPNAMDTADFIVLFGDDGTFRNLINPVYYKVVIEDLERNFYLFKKVDGRTCEGCNP